MNKLILTLLFTLYFFLNWGNSYAQRVVTEKYFNWIGWQEGYGGVIRPKTDTGLITTFSSYAFGRTWTLPAGGSASAAGIGLMQVSEWGDSVKTILDTGMYGVMSKIIETSEGYAVLVNEVYPSFNDTETRRRINFYDRRLHPTYSVVLDSILGSGKIFKVRDMYFSSDSGLYVLGYVTGNPGTGWDFVLARYHQAGLLEWVTEYNLPNNQEAHFITADTSGGLLLCGTSRVGAAFILGVGRNGDIRFQKELYTQPHEILFFKARRLPEGGLIGAFSAESRDTSYLFKTDGNFNIVWKRRYKTLIPNSLWVYTNGTGAIVFNTDAIDAYRFAKFSLATGDTVWTMNLGRRSSQVVNFTDFSYYSTGDAVIVGNAPEVFSPYPATDLYFCRIQNLGLPYNPDSGLISATRPVLADKSQSLFAYPNPTSSSLTLFCPEAGTLTLYDSRGAVVLERAVRRDEKITLQLAALPKGLYVARLGPRSVRVVKE